MLGKNDPDKLEVAVYVAANMPIQFCSGNDLIVNKRKTKQLVFGRH